MDIGRRTLFGILGLGALAALAACGPVTLPVTNAYSQPSAATGAPAGTAARPSRLGLTYTVQPGDTVYSIARRADLGLRTVIEANGLEPPYILIPGRELQLPRLREHVVQSGDTISAIALRYDVSMAELVRANGLEPPYPIRVGERLVLPGQVVQAQQVSATPAVREESVAAVPSPTPTPTPGGSGIAPPGGKPAAPGSSAPAIKPPPPPSAETAAVVAAPAVTGRGFLWPVKGQVVSTFGPKKGGQHNDGVNIVAPRGTPVIAAENGVVAYAGNELRGFGNLLLIRHDGGWVSAYAHNDTLLVSRGQTVKRGQRIATVGSSGGVATPQLHFELRRKSRAVDPLSQLPTQVSAR